MTDSAHASFGYPWPVIEERVLILAPTGRDASLAAAALAEAGHQPEICQSFDHLIAGIEDGAGTAIIAEEAFSHHSLHRLGRLLSQQPSWSDIPLLILTSGGQTQEASWKTVQDLDPLGNVTLLERPFRVITLLSAVQVALRARRHQYKVRDYMVERELIETSRRQSEERLQVALAAAHMGTWVWDLRTNQDTRNASLNGILGIAETETTQSADDFMDRVHPEDRASVSQAFWSAIRNRATYEAEFRLLQPDGSVRWLRDRGKVLCDASGQPIYMTGACIDLTERKKAEQQQALLASIVACSSDAIVSKTLDGLITSWNVGAEWMYGYTAPEVLGRSISRIIPCDRQDELSVFSERLARGETIDSYETVRVRKDGSMLHVLLTLSPMYNDKGRITGASVIARDITARKRMEERLRELNETLEKRVAERTQSLIRYQQELRTMASELTLAEQRERRRLALELHDYLAQMLVVCRIKLTSITKRVRSQKAVGLLEEVDKTLDQSLTYTRTLVAELSPNVLYQFGLQAAIKWLGDQMRQHNLHVEVHESEREFHLSEDKAVLLFQAIREILFNVVKHAGTDRATVGFVHQDGDLSITVADEGAGFDVTSQRQDPVEPGKYGLFSIRERLEALDGRFELNSEPGHGTRVTLILPLEPKLAEPSQASVDALKSETLDEMGTVPDSKPLSRSRVIRVLLVDDHTMVREGLRTVVEASSDIEVVGEAANGQQAVERTRTLKPDIVIMDVNMPILNGIDATRQIKQEMPQVGVIGLSMYDNKALIASLKDAGAASYLTKGGPSDELCQIIRQVCRQTCPG